MTHGSLFSGIGGFDLAAQWMGWENIFHCEWNEFGQKVLKYYWPEAELFTDITKSDFIKYANKIDILTGGFPCQPYSHAGKRLGKEDERHLWPEMLRAIREIQPSWVVGENVSGLISWNGGLVFDEVQTDLEAEGYEVWPVVLPAAGVGAPHRRDRVWFIAYSESGRINRINGNDTGKTGQNRKRNDEFNGSSSGPTPNPANIGHEPSGGTWARWAGFTDGDSKPTTNPDSNGHELRGFGEDRPAQGKSISQQEQRQRIWTNNRGISEQGIIANTDSSRRGQGPIQSELRATEPEQLRRNTRETGQAENGEGQKGEGRRQWNIPAWDNFPTQPPVRSRNDGVSTGLAGITVSKHRNESIKAYGNAIVPQVAYEIFKAINQLVGAI